MGFMTRSVANDYQLAGRDRGGDVAYEDGAGALTCLLSSWTALTQREIAAFGGVFSEGDRVYTLGANQFPLARQPRQGATLRDLTDGSEWTIPLECTLDAHGARWTVHAKRKRENG